MRPTRAVLVFLFLCSAALIAQERSTVMAQANTVYVSADGRVEADPDLAIITFNVAPQEKSAKAAYEHAARDVEQIRELLRANQFDPKLAQVGPFSLQPIYEWTGGKRKPTAYRATTAVTVKLKEFDKVAHLLEGIENLDVTGTQQVTYALQDVEAAKARAVEDAFQHAHTAALALAKAGGRELGNLNSSSIDVAEARPREDDYYAEHGRYPFLLSSPAARMPVPPTEELTPTKITVVAHVNASFNLKPLQ